MVRVVLTWPPAALWSGIGWTAVGGGGGGREGERGREEGGGVEGEGVKQYYWKPIS